MSRAILIGAGIIITSLILLIANFHIRHSNLYIISTIAGWMINHNHLVSLNSVQERLDLVIRGFNHYE